MTFRRITTIICSVLLAVGICSHVFVGADIYAIIVADTLSPTGKGASADLDRLRQEVATLSHYTGLKLHLSVFKADEVTVSAISNAVKTLPVSPEDVTLFYYLGHGYRTSHKSTVWPYLYLCHDRKGVDLSEIIENIISKKPRMALIVGDCCNNVMDDEEACPWECHMKLSQYGVSPAHGYRALFLNFEGIVIACASEAGDYAYCRDDGHVFTGAFCRALHEEVLRSKPNWASLLQRTAHKIENLQTTYHEILCYP